MRVTAKLTDKSILVTRPVGQSAGLARLIRDAGGAPVLFPALEIEPLTGTQMESALNRLALFDLVIFVSANAVRFGLPHIQKRGGLPARAGVAAVGSATAAELKKFGVRNIILSQQGFDSEALLGELAAMSMDRARTLIVRGQGGRAFLGESLHSRGALVEYLECYRRVKPQRDMRDLQSGLGNDSIDACLATSSSIVENLFEMAGQSGGAWLCSLPFFVAHPRVAATAFSRGVRSVFVAGNGDEALISGLQIWFAPLRFPGASSPSENHSMRKT